jgi:hypothetical protein
MLDGATASLFSIAELASSPLAYEKCRDEGEISQKSVSKLAAIVPVELLMGSTGGGEESSRLFSTAVPIVGGGTMAGTGVSAGRGGVLSKSMSRKFVESSKQYEISAISGDVSMRVFSLRGP